MGCLGSDFDVRHCVKVSEFANDEFDSHMVTMKKIKASNVVLERFILNDEIRTKQFFVFVDFVMAFEGIYITIEN